MPRFDDFDRTKAPLEQPEQMLPMTRPLLSVIIPTKNRPRTAVYAVASALALAPEDVEVIVHDCSDDDALHAALAERFGDDPRLRYVHVREPLSMTENWTRALTLTTGSFVCGIGDDDAVLPELMDVVRWMLTSGTDAIVPQWITYFWDDAMVGTYNNSRLTFASSYTGLGYEVDVPRQYTRKVRSCGFGYSHDLPNLYHAVVSRRCFERHEEAHGMLLGSTSLDVYCAFMLSCYVQRLVYVDYPLTIRGVCGKSNTNRYVQKRGREHFQEFRELTIPECLPQILNSEVSIAESTIVALQDTDRHALLEKMDLAVVYAKCAASELRLLPSLYRRFLRRRSSERSHRFAILFIKFLRARVAIWAREVAMRIMGRHPRLNTLIERASGKQKPQVSDIATACAYIREFSRQHGRHLRLEERTQMHVPTPALWD